MGRSEDQESVNPGIVEREGMQGGSVEREGMSDGGGSVERESMGAGAADVERDSVGADDARMRASGREGGYGYDRPVDLPPTRDTGERARGTDTTRGRGDLDNMARDW